MPKSKVPFRRLRKKNSDGQVIGFKPSETMAQFLERGGKITKVKPGNAEQCLPGTAYFDGGVYINTMGTPEYVPNYVVSEATWNSSQNDRPDVLLAQAWREKEIDSLPVELRQIATKRSPDAFESTGDEITKYYDEIEPEE